MSVVQTITATVINTDSLPKATADANSLQTVLNIVFALIASLSLLIIVIAGFRYIVAHGDPSAVAQARKAILYAVVGLVVTIAAFSIVTFVVKGVS